ncbi:MAG TPA: hypothetical protein DCM40_25885, partial [Maribacter sp.]|nr:hypothetical protein [Maribacter sp.]
KLDLITEGYSIAIEEAPPIDVEEISYEDTVPDPLASRIEEACEDLSAEENERRFKQYRAYAAANRREIVRRFREAALKVSEQGSELAARERSRIDLDLGPFGRYDGRDVLGEALVSLSKLAVDSDPTAASFLQTYRSTPNSISITIDELEARLRIVKEDLREAEKQAKEAYFQFDPSDFNVSKEISNLQMLVDQIKALVSEKDPNFAEFDFTGPENQAEVTIHFDFTSENIGALLSDFQ